jgi:hypothetical protein
MLIDGVFLEAKCPSPPRAGGADRAVIAASRSGSVGTQVVASAGRSRGNESPKVIGGRTVAAVSETRSSSRRQLSAPVAACIIWSRGAGIQWRVIYLAEASEVRILVMAVTAHDYRRAR